VTGCLALGPAWDDGIALLNRAGISGNAAPLALLGGGLADLCIGVGIAVRASARRALYAGLALSGLYLVGLSILAPRLWIDPLGALLKVLPLMVLTGTALAILEDR
jgi:hypothetical protein